MGWVDINKLLDNDYELTKDEKIAKREMEKKPHFDNIKRKNYTKVEQDFNRELLISSFINNIEV